MIKIDKNSQEFIGITEQVFQKSPVVDIRIWRRSHQSPEGYRTRKGLTIAKSHLEALLGGLARLHDEKKVHRAD